MTEKRRESRWGAERKTKKARKMPDPDERLRGVPQPCGRLDIDSTSLLYSQHCLPSVFPLSSVSYQSYSHISYNHPAFCHPSIVNISGLFNLPLRIQGLFLTYFASLKTSSEASSHLQTNGRIYGCTGSEWDWFSAWEFVLQTSPLLTLVMKTTIIMNLWYHSSIQLCSLQTPILNLLRL